MVVEYVFLKSANAETVMRRDSGVISDEVGWIEDELVLLREPATQAPAPLVASGFNSTSTGEKIARPQAVADAEAALLSIPRFHAPKLRVENLREGLAGERHNGRLTIGGDVISRSDGGWKAIHVLRHECAHSFQH